MLLDFEHLTREIEILSGIKPIPHRLYVEEYIKAFYLPENCLEEWIAKHPVRTFCVCCLWKRWESLSGIQHLTSFKFAECYCN